MLPFIVVDLCVCIYTYVDGYLCFYAYVYIYSLRCAKGWNDAEHHVDEYFCPLNRVENATQGII